MCRSRAANRGVQAKVPQAKVPQACTQTDCRPSASNPGMHMQNANPWMLVEEKGGDCASGRHTSYFLEHCTVSVRLRVSERTGFRVAVGPRRRWADTGCLVAFCISRVVRVQMRISIWNPAPRRHRADKASLGRLDRIIESPLALQSPSLRPEPGAGKCLSRSVSASLRLFACCTRILPPSMFLFFSKTDAKERGA